MNIAAVFPGQGSQSPGMLADLAAEYSVIKQTFDEASAVLDYDLWDIAQNGSEEQQRETAITQPLVFVGDLAVWRVWRELGFPQPVVMAGHSLGEYAALTAAEAIPFGRAVELVQKRAQLMSEAVAPGIGGMAAVIGMDDEKLIELCEANSNAQGIVEAVNFNSPGQVVISGHLSALEELCELARQNGARKAMLLPVSVPNHSSLMRNAEAELANKIESSGIQAPEIPVIQNASASVPSSVASLVDSLKKHVVSPVQWTNTVKRMAEYEVEGIVEMGPGKVLSGLSRRIDKSLAAYPTENKALLEKAGTALNKSGETHAE